jgi:hypothetical protein
MKPKHKKFLGNVALFCALFLIFMVTLKDKQIYFGILIMLCLYSSLYFILSAEIKEDH